MRYAIHIYLFILTCHNFLDEWCQLIGIAKRTRIVADVTFASKKHELIHIVSNMSDNILFTWSFSLQKSEREANMILNTQTVAQELLFSELNDGSNMKSLFQILVSRKYYMNFKIWLYSLYVILPTWTRFCGPPFFIIQELDFLD